MRQPSQEREERSVRKTVRWRLAFVILLAAAGAACGDNSVTGGEQEQALTCPSAGVPFCASPNDARQGTADALGRSTPALQNATARADLTTSLGQLNAALNDGAGNITDAQAAVRRSREVLATARGQVATFPSDAPDLGAIELLLNALAPLIGMT
jgi:hypothetical protein